MAVGDPGDGIGDERVASAEAWRGTARGGRQAQDRILGPRPTRTTRFNFLFALHDVAAAQPHLEALEILETLPDADLSAHERNIRDQLPSLRQRLAQG